MELPCAPRSRAGRQTCPARPQPASPSLRPARPDRPASRPACRADLTRANARQRPLPGTPQHPDAPPIALERGSGNLSPGPAAPERRHRSSTHCACRARCPLPPMKKLVSDLLAHPVRRVPPRRARPLSRRRGCPARCLMISARRESRRTARAPQRLVCSPSIGQVLRLLTTPAHVRAGWRGGRSCSPVPDPAGARGPGSPGCHGDTPWREACRSGPPPRSPGGCG